MFCKNYVWEVWATSEIVEPHIWLDKTFSKEYPCIANLKNAEQDPKFHPETNAYCHTYYVVEAMHKLCIAQDIKEERRFLLMMSALCHDYGKAVSTRWHEEKKKWVSYGHDVTGVPIAKQFLEEIGCREDIREKVLKLVRWHMVHVQKEFTDKMTTKLLTNLSPASVEDLIVLCYADCAGRPPLDPEPSEAFKSWAKKVVLL